MAVKGKKCQDLKTVDWISSSFSDSFGCLEDDSPAEKRVKLEKNDDFEDFDICEDDLISIENEYLIGRNKAVAKISKCYSTWCEKYKPKSVDDLVINKKKISELENWLKTVFLYDNNYRNKSNLLLLTGPTGSGKLCTLKVLCDGLGINIIEWITPMDMSCDYSGNGIGDSWKMRQTSATQLFGDFILRSSKYNSLLSLDCDRSVKKIVLVKDFPNTFLDKPEVFHQLLEKYYDSCNSDYHISPIVFIQSCPNIIRELFSDEIKSKMNIMTINFNPVTETNIIKALNRILLLESKNNSVKFKMPSKEDLLSISDSSDGDIRSAILKLQFNLDNVGDTNSNDCFKMPKAVVNQTRIKVKKSSSSKNKVCEIDKDKKIDFFNSVGRVLYPKKEIIVSKGVTGSKQNYKFVHSPDTIVDSFLVEPNKFINMLHENYLDRFTDIKDVCIAASSLSLSDFLMSSWEVRDVMIKYGLTTVVRTLMTSNSSPAPNSWKPLSKSKIWITENNRIDNLKAIRSIFPDVQSEKDVLLDVIPLLKNLNVNLTPEQDRIISKIVSYKH